MSKLVNHTPIDGEPLSATEFDNYLLLLVVAGNETTLAARGLKFDGQIVYARPPHPA